jgi:hypothetical protein
VTVSVTRKKKKRRGDRDEDQTVGKHNNVLVRGEAQAKQDNFMLFAQLLLE